MKFTRCISYTVSMKRSSLFQKILIAICLAGFVMPAMGLCTDLSLHGDRITLHVQDVPLRTILQEFLHMGVAVQIAPSINPRVTVSLDNRELRQGLNALVQPYSYALIWKSAHATVASNTSLTELQIFAPGNRADMAYMATPEQPRYIKGELLVQLTGKPTPAQLQRIARQVGGVVVGGNPALGIYKLRVDKAADIPLLAAMINRQGEALAEPNYLFQAEPPILLEPSSAAATEEEATDQKSIGKTAVAVLDSGLFPGYGLEEYVSAAYDPEHPNQPLTDSMGHGTQMAMISTGMIIPDGIDNTDNHELAPVIPIKIFNDDGLTSNYTLLQSITFAEQHDGRILSLSWETDTPSTFLQQALDNARDNGAIIFAAAGNQPTGKPVYPAAYDSVIAVGALAADGSRWEYSNYGSFVDIYAPGVATFPVGNQGEAGTYAGTSISTAYIAGLAAGYLSNHPQATREELTTFLGISSSQTGSQ